jgi:4-aminobutyrate aminotransferase-like enzyme
MLRDAREPVPRSGPTRICDRMLELGVVIQPTGDSNNVLKVKPPLCITRESADVVVAALERTLAEGW